MRRRKEVEKDENGYTVMSKYTLKVICENEELYEFPDLNEKLYLQFKGFHKIENLDEYINIKAIWLNNNGIMKIEGLEYQKLLISLFLNNNLIPKMENFSHCTNLMTLNLSHNRISKIENLSTLTRLGNIDLSSNIIQGYDGLIGVLECPSLTNIDLTNNIIDHDDRIIDIFIQMPQLACLYLRNNPCVREFKNYRKRLIGYIASLKYLDDRPVFPNERRVAEAWIRDGREGEMSEREAIMKERDQKNLKNFEEMMAMQEEIKKKRKNFFVKARRDYAKEVERIERVIAKCKSEGKSQIYIELLEQDLSRELQKIKDLELNAESLSVAEHSTTIKSFSSTTNPDGSVTIWNKTEEEVNQIKEEFFDNPNVQKTRTREEIEEERQKKRDEERLHKMEEQERENELLKKKEELEEEEKRKREFIDYSTQWKTFMLADKEKEEKEKNLQEQYKAMANPQVSLRQLRHRWVDGDYDELLENLLLRYTFDFEKAGVEFNKIAAEVMRGVGKFFQEFSSDDLRKLWTYIEVNKFRKNRTAEEYVKIQEEIRDKQLKQEQMEKEKLEQEAKIKAAQEAQKRKEQAEKEASAAAERERERERQMREARKEIEEMKRNIRDLGEENLKKENKVTAEAEVVVAEKNNNDNDMQDTSEVFKRIEENAIVVDLDGLD